MRHKPFKDYLILLLCIFAGAVILRMVMYFFSIEIIHIPVLDPVAFWLMERVRDVGHAFEHATSGIRFGL